MPAVAEVGHRRPQGAADEGGEGAVGHAAAEGRQVEVDQVPEVLQGEGRPPAHAPHEGTAHDGEVEHGHEGGEGAGHAGEHGRRGAREPPGAGVALAHGARHQPLGLGVQVPACPVGCHGARQEADVEHGRPGQVAVAGELHVDAGGHGLEGPADHHGGAVVGDGAHECEQEAGGKGGAHQRHHHVEEHPGARRPQVGGGGHEASVDAGDARLQQHHVHGAEEEPLHHHDAEPAVGVARQAEQPMGHQAPPAEELDVGEGREKRGRYHGQQRGAAGGRAQPARPEGTHHGHRQGHGAGKGGGEHAAEQRVRDQG